MAWRVQVGIDVCVFRCKKMRALVILMACMATAHAASKSEVDCMVRILHAEAQGESFEGMVAVGQSVINRSVRQKTTVCQISGVSKRKPPMGMLAYYKALAASLIANTSNTIAKGADSWNTGKKPRQPGEITRIIGGHTFYVARAEQ
jgi:hypothetical protein